MYGHEVKPFCSPIPAGRHGTVRAKDHDRLLPPGTSVILPPFFEPLASRNVDGHHRPAAECGLSEDHLLGRNEGVNCVCVSMMLWHLCSMVMFNACELCERRRVRLKRWQEVSPSASPMQMPYFRIKYPGAKPSIERICTPQLVVT
jgi:hypothetical protein